MKNERSVRHVVARVLTHLLLGGGKGSRVGAAFMVCLLATLVPTPAAAGNVKIAFWNMRSGKGAVALPGHPSTFADTSNCTDATLPLNAWGIGLVQQELVAKIKNDPEVVALGVAEAWTTICASPENIRAALGWAARTDKRNGVAIIAKYGFAGAATWQQLDTSLNVSPTDTMWVLRTQVCLDAACLSWMNVFTTHWYGVPSELDIQGKQTVDFAATLPAGEPHVLIGDSHLQLTADRGPTMSAHSIVRTRVPFSRRIPLSWTKGRRDADFLS